MTKPFVAVLMGSDSDLPVLEFTLDVLDRLRIPCEVKITSAHRTPGATHAYVKDADARGCGVFIAAAGLAAHLAGTVAGLTLKPVIGIPLLPDHDEVSLDLQAVFTRCYDTGPYQDYELFGEFMAIGTFLAVFMAARAQTPNQRFYGATLAVLCVVMLLASVTRGATVAFLIGGIYLLWSLRKTLKMREFVTILLVSVALFQILEFGLTNFTRAGSITERMMNTYFVGLTPDTRVGWGKLWERAMDHPFVGHGPYYDLGMSRGITGKGLYTYTWPHNQYLYYAHTVGLFGLAAFAFIALRLVVLSARSKGRGLRDGSYAKSLMVVLHVMLVVFLVGWGIGGGLALGGLLCAKR